MHESGTPSDLSGPGIMLLSAALFGYFGFTTQWNSTGMNGQYLLFVDLQEWALKGSAILFLLCAVLTFVRPVVGNVVYSVVGLLGAAMFVAAAVMDILDTQHIATSPLLLLLFAALNGYGSIASLRAIMSRRKSDADAR